MRFFWVAVGRCECFYRVSGWLRVTLDDLVGVVGGCG